jgi:metallophosphoesterase superfamily enzyme
VIEPIRGEPALRLELRGSVGGPTVIVADLHLGLGAIADRPGGPPEASAEFLAERLQTILERAGARRLLVAGDVKHPIVGTPPALRPVLFDFFGRLLAAGHEVDVVLGNHDVGLTRWLPREVTVHAAGGVVRDGVGVFHGHRWPSNPVLRSSTIVAGHLHPGYRLAPTADDPSGKRPCWVRVRRAPVRPRSRRRRAHAPLLAREIVILPPFNPIAGIEALNRERPARGRSFLYGRFLSQGEARAFLLDGTDLGRLPTGPAVEATREAERARPGR